MSELAVGSTVWYRQTYFYSKPRDWEAVRIVAETSRSWVVKLHGWDEKKLAKKAPWPSNFVKSKEEADEITRVEAVMAQNKTLARVLGDKLSYGTTSQISPDLVNAKLREIAEIIGYAMPQPPEASSGHER